MPQPFDQQKVKPTGVYLRPEQVVRIEELKLKLLKNGFKVSNSELARAAFDLLFELDEDALIKRLTDH